MLKHASIVPLIGGETIGQMQALGSKPDYLLSYSPFAKNDSHLVKHLVDVPYILLDQGGKHPWSVDIVNAVCPCAGLSSLSPSANSEAAANDWMTTTAQYVLGEMKPRVFWGENAPRFAGAMGKPVVAKLMKIAQANGYTMSIYKTKSLLHGLSQVRERSFYFFWRDNRVPVFQYINRPHIKIEDLLKSVNPNASQNQLTNHKTPSKDDPYYRYILEVIEGGMSHAEFVKRSEKTVDVMWHIEQMGHSYRDVKKYFLEWGFTREAAKLDKMQDKLDAGGNIMRRQSIIPKNYIGAFVGHLPYALTHPVEDRYITYREAMSIMGLPEDFEMIEPSKNLNHVCQNVPVTTAKDMALEIIEVLSGNREMRSGELLYQFNGQEKIDLIDTGPPNTLESFL